jgi:hypothetical protein
MALCYLAGLDECVGDVHHKLSAVQSDALWRNDIRAADRIDLWPVP